MNWVLTSKFCEMTGYTDEAVKSKIRHGHWLQNVIWCKRGGRRHINIEEYEKWVMGLDQHPSQQ